MLCDSGSLYGTIHIVLFVGLRVLRMCATKEDMNKGTVLQGTKTSYLALMQTLALTLHSLKYREELKGDLGMAASLLDIASNFWGEGLG